MIWPLPTSKSKSAGISRPEDGVRMYHSTNVNQKACMITLSAWTAWIKTKRQGGGSYEQ